MEGAGKTGIEISEEDMYKLMKEEVIGFIADLFISLQQTQITQHDEISKRIKTYMDRTFGSAWHVVVGKGFGSSVTYINHHFLFLYIANKAIMIFKY